MTVDRPSAFKDVYAGTMYFFCSEDCMNRFHAAPEKYMGSSERKIS